MFKVSLASARVNAGFSQKEAAKELKISNKTLSSWEKGKSMPNAKQIDKLCKLYNVHYDCLNFLPANSL